MQKQRRFLPIAGHKGLLYAKALIVHWQHLAIEYDLEILHRDRDFDHIAKVYQLRIYPCG
jgi:hypothetical protein